MDATILVTAAAGLGTGVGYLLNAIRHRRQEANAAEATTLEDVARELRKLATIVQVKFAGLPEMVEEHGTDIRLLKREVREIRSDITDARRENAELEDRVRNVERRLP